ncbi:MAG: hypothetical protein K1X92_08575 [Bacteroidia bacterium]|nr:hypothetical protein [Bacteroidia bacterium]
MKKYLFTILVCIFATGCENKNQWDESWGTACAVLNGKKWKGEPSAFYLSNKHPDLMFVRVRSNSSSEILTINAIPFKTDVYEINRKNDQIRPDTMPNSNFDLWNGDTPREIYEIDTTETNTFRLIRFNEKTKVLEAEFDLHFVKGPGIPGLTFPDPNAPEKLHFEDGHLKTKIMD